MAPNKRFGEFFRHFRLMLGVSEDDIQDSGFPTYVLRDIESGIAVATNWQIEWLMYVLTKKMQDPDQL